MIKQLINSLKTYFAKTPDVEGITSKDLFKDKHTKVIAERTKELIADCNCTICDKGVEKECKINTTSNRYLKEVLEKIEIDQSKETILLLDDNVGVLSFLDDDLNTLNKEGQINLSDYNVLQLDGKLAAFKLRAILLSGQQLNIKYAILDITLGGTLFNDEGLNITLDGVDAYIDISKYYKDVNYLFYTGNKLNPYIKKNEMILKKFNDYTGENLEDHVLFKTSLNRKERLGYLSSFFTK